MLIIGLISVAAITSVVGCAQDILITDFEGKDYGDWKVDGEAFGSGPARGTLAGQMQVSGFQGEGLVNTYYKGDGSTGTLTSPLFKIDRKYINFLVGGGKYPGKTCMNLLVGDKVVRTATGPNDRSGGSEELDWHSWDVSDLQGKDAQIQIVDQRSDGWGHINVDHIVQSNNQVKSITNHSREFLLQKHYLNLPVKNGARKRLMQLVIDETVVRDFDIALAPGEPDFWVFIDVRPYRGKKAVLRIDKYDPQKNQGFDAIYQDNTYPGRENLYKEKLRPQFHFSSRRGWNNDSNGMVYYDGEYHLFYQHNPFGWPWGNMTWGHAVSKDMIHWQELDDAIHPDELGTIFSGSAVVDEKNTAGFQTGKEKVIVCIYTSAGGRNFLSKGQPFSQSIAYSNDRGRTWKKYEKNPIIKHIKKSNRDPKVIWHEPTNQWAMALYLDDREMGFFTSKDLKSWQYHSKIKCFHECPELFELPIDGNKQNKKWILYGGSGDYLIGHFDGKEFKPEAGPIKFHYGNCFYASQTFNNIPKADGRRLQIAWGRVKMPDMPFNQMMLFPVNLALRTTEEGPRLFVEPIREIETLHQKKWQWKDQKVNPGENPLAKLKGELFHIRAELQVGQCTECGFLIRDIPVVYNVQKKELSCQGKTVPLKPVNGIISLELLVDRTSIEFFGNRGRRYMPIGVHLVDKPKSLNIYVKEGDRKIVNLEVFELKSAWR